MSNRDQVQYPPGYLKTIDLMLTAGRSWLLTRPVAELRFVELPPDIAIACDLATAALWYGLNDASREFLLMLDKASNEQATLIQACVVIDMLFEGRARA